MDGAGLGEDDPDRKYISDGINRMPNLQLLPGRGKREEIDNVSASVDGFGRLRG